VKTYGEQFDEALACKDSVEAGAWLEQEISRYKIEFDIVQEKARETIMANLGYMAGYYDHVTADRIYELFGAVHPIFGRSFPIAEEALETGYQAGRTEGQAKGGGG